MKKFQYRLQTKLNIVLKQEEVAQDKLAQRQREYHNETVKLEVLNGELDGVYNRIRGSEQRTVSIDEVVIFSSYIPLVRDKIQQQSITVDQARREVILARANLVEIMRSRRVLEKLRENKWQAYLCEFHCQEQKILDEVALTRFWRVNHMGNRQV